VSALRCPVPGCRDLAGRIPRELTGAPICGTCERRAGQALTGLPLVYVGLRTSVASSVAGEFITGTPSSGEPLNVEHRAYASHIHDRLVGWEDVARGLRQLSARPVTVREGWAVGQAVRVLEAHAAELWAHPAYAPELAADVLRLRQRARTLLGWTSADRHHLAPPCPHCELKALVRYTGGGDGDRVVCINCHARWDQADYLRFVRIMADAIDLAGAS
jgi:hypothetical protein